MYLAALVLLDKDLLVEIHLMAAALLVAVVQAAVEQDLLDLIL
jgi:hypothetical protein